jgi:RNA polymerase sigma factor (sigma-70 family)
VPVPPIRSSRNRFSARFVCKEIGAAGVDHVMETASVSGRDGEHAARPIRAVAARPEERWAAFGELYRAEGERLIRVGLLMTGSVETAQDVVQDSFVGVWRRWDQLHDPAGYLYRSVVNGCRSHHRRAAREQRLKGLVSAVWPASATAPVESNDLGDALASLPYRQRAALVLRFYDDMSEADAAVVLGCRPGTVGSLVHRALAQLKKVIEL